MAKYHRSQLLSYACACALGVAANQAYAQTTAQTAGPSPSTTVSLDEVVVTGSYLPTLPEDAAIPVEVINYDDLKNMGRPSNLDLVKGLTESGQTVGELDRQNAYPIDAATVNLRNLGPRFTTVVFNNRRFPEQFSPAVGRFNNINSIPNAVIGNVEVLKSGGAAVYGADAVAGVVNYMTRKNVKGLELNAEYKYIADSDGDYNIDGIWGTDVGDGDFMIAASYQKRSILEREDRDFTNRPYLENPDGWTTYGNPGAYVFQAPVGAGGAMTNQVSADPALVPGARQRSNPVPFVAGTGGTIRDPACQVLGGYAGLSSAGSPICYGNYVGVERLVEEMDQVSLYAEFNQELGGLDFHLEALGGYRELPDAGVLTRTGPLTFPVAGAPITTAGTTFGQYGNNTISSLSSYTATAANPAAAIFLNQQFLNANGTTAYSGTQITNMLNPANPGRVGLLQTLWTVYGAGGNPLGENYDYQRNSTTQGRLSGSLGGDIPAFLGMELEWEVALTYHYTKDVRWTRDIPTWKLQNALNGFGGANCNPALAMPGTGGAGTFVGTPGQAGCYFYNPFSSAISHNMYSGIPNTATFVGTGSYTGYVPGMGLQNNPEVVRWLYEPVSLRRDYNNYVVDPIIRGETGVELPGGNMQIAFGGQFRRQDEEVDISDNSDRSINPCPWLPNGTRTTAPAFNPVTKRYDVLTSAYTGTQSACTGAMTFSKAFTVLGGQANNYRDDKRQYPVAAVFAQFKLPILDTLNADIVGRYEKFFSDVTDIDNDVFVPAIALKWDITDWVSMRTSYGQTFSQVNPPRPDNPTPANGTIGTSGTYATFNYPNLGVKPEEGENFSVGFIFASGDFRATLDYNVLTIENFSRTLTAAQVVGAALLPGEVISNAGALLDCSSPLLNQTIPGFNNNPYIKLNGNGSCQPGQSRLNSPGTAGVNGLIGGDVNFYGQQGQVNSGTLWNNALDVSMSYSFDALGGRLIPSLNATYVTKWELDDFVVAGVKIADGYDGVGYRNLTTGRLLQGVPEYRLGFGLVYSRDRHTVNLIGSYIPSVINENAAEFNATSSRNANVGPDSSVGCPAYPSGTADLGSYPAGAGTAEFGTTCPGYNMAILSGAKISSYFNLDLIYRMEVTDSLDMSLNIVNLLDTDPSFARNQLAYDAGYGSPLGRTVEISASFKF
jgi:iron complex outermembrane receptor protein